MLFDTAEIVKQFIRSYIDRRRKADETYQAIADDLGVSKAHVVNLYVHGRASGRKVEEAVAVAAYSGSIDELRKAAREWWESGGRFTGELPGRSPGAEPAPPAPSTFTDYDDRYPSRARAVATARAEGYDPRAISDVQKQAFDAPSDAPDPNAWDPGFRFWMAELDAAVARYARLDAGRGTSMLVDGPGVRVLARPVKRKP